MYPTRTDDEDSTTERVENIFTRLDTISTTKLNRHSELWLQVFGLLDITGLGTADDDALYRIVDLVEEWSSVAPIELPNSARASWYSQAIRAATELTSRHALVNIDHFDAARVIARQINDTLNRYPKAVHDIYTVIVDQIQELLIDARLIPDDRPTGADLETV